ncbi:MAG: DCC1-like thiol-disulfide oxidoreductase family protein [Saprospiraceae bacterium]
MSQHKLNEISLKHPVVIYDGVCHLCDGSVRWLVEHDRRRVFRFCQMQSMDIDIFSNMPGDTVVLHWQEKAYLQSSAVLQILILMGGVYRWVGWIGHIIPSFIRDWVYRQVAARRYLWFGKADKCNSPPDDWGDIMIDWEKDM